MTIPHSWVRFTQENIARSQREREISEKLRGDIDALLRMCANQMWAQFNSVNNAFNERLQFTQDAKNKLQNHLERVSIKYLNRIYDISYLICLLRLHNKTTILIYLLNIIVRFTSVH